MMSAMAQCKNPGCKEEAKRLYCSVKCKKAYHNAKRPKVGKTKTQCVACGKSFVASRAHAQTCSDACRNKVHHARKVWVKAKRSVVPRTGLMISFDANNQVTVGDGKTTPRAPIKIDPKTGKPVAVIRKVKAKKKAPIKKRKAS